MSDHYDSEVEWALLHGADPEEHLRGLLHREEPVYDVDCSQTHDESVLLAFLNSLPKSIPMTDAQFKEFIEVHHAGLMVHCKRDDLASASSPHAKRAFDER